MGTYGPDPRPGDRGRRSRRGEAQDIIGAPPPPARTRAARQAGARDARPDRPGEGRRDPWDLKLAAGGLIDVEFIAQYLSLAFAHAHPGILDVSTRKVIDKAGRAGLLSRAHVETLIRAHRLYTDATQFMRLAIAGEFDPAKAAAGVKRRIAAAAGFPDFQAFVAALDEARKSVRAAFDAIV